MLSVRCEIVALSIFGPLSSVQLLSLLFQTRRTLTHHWGRFGPRAAPNRAWRREETVTPLGSEGRHHLNNKNSAPFVLSAAVSPLACVYYTEGEAVCQHTNKREPLFNSAEACLSLQKRTGMHGLSDDVWRSSASLILPHYSLTCHPSPLVSGHVRLTHISASALCN